MAEVLLFHHSLGLTDGCLSFAEEIRAAEHVVHTPDLFEGRTFTQVTDGVAYAGEVGFDTIMKRGEAAADGLPKETVYGGFSLGAMPAQKLAQTRPGAKGALLFHAAIPTSEFGGRWPPGLPLQIHVMEDDELGDVEIARDLAETIESAELFLYPGDGHLFAERGGPEYDERAAMLLRRRVLDFLDTVG
jgi:dienelactone hydrolase